MCLTARSHDVWGPCWSPDGRTIAFLRETVGGLEVATVPSNGGEVKVIGSLTQAKTDIPNRLAWAADPDAVVVSDGTPGISGDASLYSISIRTGERHLLDAAPPWANHGCH